MATSITQHGITVTFSEDKVVGQYVNGDWYVQVGASETLTITGITVASGARAAGSVAGRDGAMLNPTPGTTQGFDSRISGYNAALNKVAGGFPITMTAGQSLVCAESADPPRSYHPGNDLNLETAIVLTTEEVILSDMFRPHYCSGTKHQFTWAASIPNALPALAAPANTPTLATVSSRLQRVWLDFMIGWNGRYIHPYQNMRDYGNEITRQGSDALLMMLLNSATIGDKAELVQNIIQIGIDMYGVAMAGGYWPADGGHGAGRKAFITIAGHLLGHDGMKNIGTSKRFQDDEQTFYVTNEDVLRDVGYVSGDINTPEWGLRHAKEPDRDNASLSSPYRWVASTWMGHALAPMVLDIQSSWKWNAYFDYVDRHFSTIVPANVGVANYEPDTFHQNMYDTYWATYYTPSAPAPRLQVRVN